MSPQLANTIRMQDKLVYSSISSNRNEKNLCSKGNYLLYSRCKCPIIYDLKQNQLAAYLVGHHGEVNGQCFVDTFEDRCDETDQNYYVISTAHDKTAIIWKLLYEGERNHEAISSNYKLLYQFNSPDNSVFQSRCSLTLDGVHFLSVLTTIEGNIYLFKNEQVIQTIMTNNCYFDAKFFTIKYTIQSAEQQVIEFRFVSLAGSDNKVHIYLLDDRSRLVQVLDLANFNDWIKCLDFLPLPTKQGEFLLAAACQDSLIHVWHLKLTNIDLDASTRVRTNVSKSLYDYISSTDQTAKSITLTSTLETVLSGHESFVLSLCWFKGKLDSNQLQLISCSADRTIIIWQSTIAVQTDQLSGQTKKYDQCPASEGVWKQAMQLGETGEANLPFLGVCLSNDESTIYAQTLRGAIHLWSSSSTGAGSTWMPRTSITGHFDSITDIAWEKTGSYLLTASSDKTCRLHAIADEDKKWHEIARPQVHGYEINCLAPLNFIKFASGAEEKTIRTFEATQFFLKNFQAITKTELTSDCFESASLDELPVHAQLPALGLSNRGSHCPFDINDNSGSGGSAAVAADQLSKTKARESSQTSGSKSDDNLMMTTTKIASKMNLSDNNSWHEVSELVKQIATTDHLDTIPFEEILIQSTLWWEKNKLFGHCNELHALASDRSGKFLASASKANRADLASVIIWETEKYRKVATLEHHTLTITRLRFSPDDNYLLSVSRDRTWCLYERNPSGQLRNAYRKLIGTTKSNAIHERIIWDCCWTYDSKYFCTVSRDKKAIIWSVERLRSQINDRAAAAAAAAPDTISNSHDQQVLNKSIVSVESFDRSVQAVDSPMTNLLPVNQLQTRSQSPPSPSSSSSSAYLFALGFEDGSMELQFVSALDGDANSSENKFEWQQLKSFTNFHQLAIRRLAFQPLMQRNLTPDGNVDDKLDHTQELLLASGGDDCVVKLTRLLIAAN